MESWSYRPGSSIADELDVTFDDYSGDFAIVCPSTPNKIVSLIMFFDNNRYQKQTAVSVTYATSETRLDRMMSPLSEDGDVSILGQHYNISGRTISGTLGWASYFDYLTVGQITVYYLS